MPAQSVDVRKSFPFQIAALLDLFRNDVSSVNRILYKFRKEVSASIEQIEAMISTGRMEEARRLLHTLKGTAGIVLADDLYNIVARFEQSIGTGQIEHIPACLQKLRAEITRCQNHIPQALIIVEKRAGISSKQGTTCEL